MTDEVVLVYKTPAEAAAAYWELLENGLPREHLAVCESRALGPLCFETHGQKGALWGATAGIFVAALTAFIVSLLASGALVSSLEIAAVAALIGAGVGAFIGGVAGLEADQPEGLDVVESLFMRGFALDAEPTGRDEARAVRRIAKSTHAALATREV